VLYGSFRASIGQRLSTLTPDDYSNYQRVGIGVIVPRKTVSADGVEKHLYVGVIVAHLSYGLVKLGVLQFYKRVFPIPTFRKWANVMLVIVGMFMLAATLVSQYRTQAMAGDADGPDSNILGMAHLQLVDARQELPDQLRGIFDLVRRYRSVS
jgi:hypothetical protein